MSQHVMPSKTLQVCYLRVMIQDMTTASNSHDRTWRPTDSLANRFKLMRAELGLSQKEFGDRAGIPASQIQSIEDGKSPRQLDVKVKKIAMAFGVDRDWLMWGGALATIDDPEGGDDNESLLSGSNGRPLAYKVAPLPGTVVEVNFTRKPITAPGVAA